MRRRGRGGGAELTSNFRRQVRCVSRLPCQEAYNAAMRPGNTHLVAFTVVCVLFCTRNVNAQNANCPPESAPASDSKNPSGLEVSISGVTFFWIHPTTDFGPGPDCFLDQ